MIADLFPKKKIGASHEGATGNRGLSAPVDILFLSDIHLLHPAVSTEYICKNLFRYFGDYLAKSPSIDYIVIAGDFWEQIRHFPDGEVFAAQAFMNWLLDICYNRNIRLRVLEGTPYHDRGQSRQFVTLNEARPEAMRANLMYIDTLDIVTEDDGLTFLYVPDEFHHDPDVVWGYVVDKLRQHNLEQVDFSITHGMYKHHLPFGVNKPAHDADLYLKITRYYVDNGHIHTPSIYEERFITNGSFDRLRQNEEHRKGFWHLHLSTTGFSDDVLTFVENDNAMPFITLDVRKKTAEEAMAVVNEHATHDYPMFIRLKMDRELYVDGLLGHYASMYPNIHWDKILDKTKKVVVLEENSQTIEKVPPVTPRNAADMIAAIMARENVDPALQARALQRFEKEQEVYHAA